MSRRFYVDTSAYLCILLGEAGHEALRRELRGGILLSSVLLVLESGRNLVRLSRDGLLTPAEFHKCMSMLADDVEQFMLRELSFGLCAARTMPAVSVPRSLDLAHLRTALWFHEQESLACFVTLDEAQKLSAREFGLPV